MDVQAAISYSGMRPPTRSWRRTFAGLPGGLRDGACRAISCLWRGSRSACGLLLLSSPVHELGLEGRPHALAGGARRCGRRRRQRIDCPSGLKSRERCGCGITRASRPRHLAGLPGMPKAHGTGWLSEIARRQPCPSQESRFRDRLKEAPQMRGFPISLAQGIRPAPMRVYQTIPDRSRSLPLCCPRWFRSSERGVSIVLGDSLTWPAERMRGLGDLRRATNALRRGRATFPCTRTSLEVR
jgi:hypothetical protein